MIDLGKLQRSDLGRIRVTDTSYKLTAICESFGEPTNVRIWVSKNKERWYAATSVGYFRVGKDTFDTAEQAEESSVRFVQEFNLSDACARLSEAFRGLGELLEQAIPMIERERSEAVAAERAAFRADIERLRLEWRLSIDASQQRALTEALDWLDARSEEGAR